MDINEIPVMLEKRVAYNMPESEIIDLCFRVMREHDSVVEKCRSAVILSAIVKPGLGKRTQQFLKNNPNLPERVNEILSSSMMRMESF